MNTERTRYSGVVATAAAVVMIAVLSLPMAPSRTIQGVDSGIFAYTGQVILDGGIPYRDAWDNKPPLVYYVNAAAIASFGGGRWSLWLAEVLVVGGAAAVLFRLFEQIGSLSSALIGTLLFGVWSRFLPLNFDGNFSESYALLPQVLCFAAGIRFCRRPSVWRAVLVGVAAGLAFLFKQTTVGVALAFVPAVVVADRTLVRSTRRWMWLASMVAGGALMVGLTALFFVSYAALDDLIYATILFPPNFLDWLNGGPVPWWQTVVHTLTTSRAMMPLVVTAPLLVAGVFRAVRPRRSPPTQPERPVLAVWALLTLLLDLALVNLSNQAYGHYYITLIPAISILVTVGLEEWRAFTTRDSRWLQPLRQVVVALVLVASSGSFLALTDLPAGGISGPVYGPAQLHPMVPYVQANTAHDDTVLVWGSSSRINYQSGRRSPTNYHFGYPLLPPIYTDRTLSDLLRDLEQARVAWIIDATLAEDEGRIPPLDAAARTEWFQAETRRETGDLQSMYSFVAANCTLSDRVYVVESAPPFHVYRCFAE